MIVANSENGIYLCQEKFPLLRFELQEVGALCPSTRDPPRPWHSTLCRLEYPFYFDIDVRLSAGLTHSKMFSDALHTQHLWTESQLVLAPPHPQFPRP